jgi:hypothetical protein
MYNEEKYYNLAAAERSEIISVIRGLIASENKILTPQHIANISSLDPVCLAGRNYASRQLKYAQVIKLPSFRSA